VTTKDQTDPPEYADWKAPAQDGAVVVWPDAGRLLPDVDRNRAALAGCDVTLQGISIARLRQLSRELLDHPAGRPLIATGHQTELYHPGVWVKEAVVDAIARRCGGIAYHFAVDTDQPKHLSIKWPGDIRPATDDPAVATAEWSGRLAGPSPAYLEQLQSAVNTAAAGWPFEPATGPFFEAMKSENPGRCEYPGPGVRPGVGPGVVGVAGLSETITAAESALDRSLGLDIRSVMVSPLLVTTPYLIFVHHLLARADRFAADYNAALADYRRGAGIKSDTRPMPDLTLEPGRIEVPFWFDHLATGTRSRASVAKTGDRWELQSGADRFWFDPEAGGHAAADSLRSWLDSRRLRLSPRALTLTMYLRLLVVDQFVHGIGGGRYDQVTDRLIRTFFGINPPRFAVATATLFFPGAGSQQRVCLPCLKREGHRIRHDLLGDRKKDVLAAIDALPRKSVARSLAFHNMHSALSAAALESSAVAEFNRRYQESVERLKVEADLFDRELFYALQPRGRLVGLMNAVRAELGLPG
jgi:hypothetical protein